MLHSGNSSFIMITTSDTERNKYMKKNIKQIIAIISLAAIAALIILFVISAFLAKPGDNTFLALFVGIITIPILAWLILFCYGRFRNQHTMAELFPEDNQK